MRSERAGEPGELRVLILVENLPVPLDRRVRQEACALSDAGHEVMVVCPQMRGFTQAEEMLEGIQIYRHWISDEARLPRVTARICQLPLGELRCALKVWRRRGFDVIRLCNPPDLLFLVALPFKRLAGVKVLFGMREGRFSAGEAGLNVMEDNAKKRGDAILKMLDDPERW